MVNYLCKGILLLIAAVSIGACTADEIVIDVYTSDIQSALDGNVIEVPVKATFKMLGQDPQGLLPKATEIIKKYMSKNTQVTQSREAIGEVLTIKTELPMATREQLNHYLTTHTRVAGLVVDSEGKRVNFLNAALIDRMNQELKSINFLLNLKMPATRTVIRIINDKKKPVTAAAVAIFIDRTAYPFAKQTIPMRQSVDFTYWGTQGSIYSQLSPSFFLD